MENGKDFGEGQTVWVRGPEEILNTLDVDGKLDGLPFMAEMMRYCGRSSRISCVPPMACVEGVGFRGLEDIVFREDLRCDGSSHDGCQRGCLLFWKKAWLDDKAPANSTEHDDASVDRAAARLKTKKGERYFCQSTELAAATSEYHPEKLSTPAKFRQFLNEVRCGEMSVLEFTRRMLNAVLSRIKDKLGVETGNTVRGHVQKTETLTLDLKPGHGVQVKDRKEIEETLDVEGKNRGLLFDPPMLDHCGKQYRVAGRLEKIILEETGRMISLKNTVVLDGVICRAWGCPRANLHYWREIWLKRIDPPAELLLSGDLTQQTLVKR